MKKEYTRPVMVGEEFRPEEYCASCTDLEGGVQYNFVCDAGGGEYGGLYDTEWNLKSRSYDSYHACGATHKSSISETYYPGWFDPDRNHDNGNEIKVYILERWEPSLFGPALNRHATTNVNKESWEKNHS